MAIPREHVPHLTVIDGRKSSASARDEIHMELLTLFAELETAARVIVNAIIGLPVPSMLALNEAHRMAARVRAARDEYLAMTDPDGAA